MPRPPKLDDEKKRRLLRLIMLGATVQQAAGGLGCSSRTVERAAARDHEFGWRLRVARSVRDTTREAAGEAAAGDPVAGLVCRLAGELRLRWAIQQGEGDKTATPDAA